MDVSIEKPTAAERLDLIEKLWDSLSDAQVPVRPEIHAEIERRLQTYPEARESAVSWEKAKSRLPESES